MFKKTQLPILGILFAISVYTQNRLAVFGVILIGSIILVIELWQKYAFKKLTIKRSLGKKQIFYGEETEYILEVENKKLLPILWLQIDDHITKGVTFLGNELLSKRIGSRINVFSDIFNMRWYEKVTRKYKVKPMKRGYYRFGKGEVQANDLFGVDNVVRETTDLTSLIVYPRVLPIDKLGLPAGNPFGRNSVNRWIYKDPSNKVGVRSYRKGDRLNQINWQATAKHQNLQSYEIKPAMDEKLYIFLDARLNEYHWEGMILEKFEVAVVCAASIVEYAIKKNCEVGLMSNGLIYEKVPYIKVEPGKGLLHRKRLLKSLAMVEPFYPKELSKMIGKQVAEMTPGSKTVIITCLITESLVQSVKLLKKRNFEPTVIKIGSIDDKWKDMLAGVRVYSVSEERLWDEIEEVRFS